LIDSIRPHGGWNGRIGEASSLLVEGVVAEGIDADRHQHRSRHYLHVAAEAAVEISGVEVDEGERGMV